MTASTDTGKTWASVFGDYLQFYHCHFSLCQTFFYLYSLCISCLFLSVSLAFLFSSFPPHNLLASRLLCFSSQKIHGIRMLFFFFLLLLLISCLLRRQTFLNEDLATISYMQEWHGPKRDQMSSLLYEIMKCFFHNCVIWALQASFAK